MMHKFDIAKILASYIGYKGIPFPIGKSLPLLQGKITTKEYDGEGDLNQADDNNYTQKGVAIRREGLRGRWYFMPVTFIDEGKEYEIPCALISVTGKKTIVETPMVGRKGSVKELISIDDYKVSIAGYVQSADGTYPENEIAQLMELYSINRSVELESALTSIVFDEGDKVVITDISFPEMQGVEDGQIVKIECLTDKEFELIIE
jgi:hypothetical protein